MNNRIFKGLALTIILGIAMGGQAAWAQAEEAAQPPSTQLRDYTIPGGDLGTALDRFADQSDLQIIYDANLVAGKTAPEVSGNYQPSEVLRQLLIGSNLDWSFVNERTLVVRGPENAAGQVGQRQPGIEEIIVTGQKREERIQDVPIAISAFSMEDLEAQKIEGGFDLLKAIPNVTFSKTNFTSYNFQIRGVGTQSISATSDPGVAVAFNNSAIIQNRLFEQEYLDVERVEVLRGPQGTLYGRNATAGVINVITNKPEMGVWDGMLDVEVGNYNTRRLRGHFNMPIGETFAIRGAYASTDREGYTFNSGTGNRVDGRDLWTGRLSLGWQPNDRLRADFIYERFEEEDDRLRTGKQLCHRDDGPEFVGNTPTVGTHPRDVGNPFSEVMRPAFFGQGCKPGSLYTDGAFDTPNGLSLPIVFATLGLFGDCDPRLSGGFACDSQFPMGMDENGQMQTIIQTKDPYGGKRQSRDLREIESILDPTYRAEADLFELSVDFDITDALQLSSQTVYVRDQTYSFQDFNRFNTEPTINDSSQWLLVPGNDYDWRNFTPNGEFCDPQLGCSDKIAGFDIAQADAKQFSQEFRLQSSLAGPINFSVGANYTKFETLVDYYVMYNLITALAYMPPMNATIDGNVDFSTCITSGYLGDDGMGGQPPPVSTSASNSLCPYIDPNPVDTSRNFGTGGNGEGEGHNYFRSKNPYELESSAVFGELYWNIQDELKLTLGLRYTDDRKIFTEVPTQVLLAPSIVAGGTVSRGYPETGKIEQQWGEWTGRLVLDWQPLLDFTDETMLYASFSRGYKGGGANPPQPGFSTLEETKELLLRDGYPEQAIPGLEALGMIPVLKLTAVEYERTFDPEFVNAFEIGTKNTLFGGALMLNGTAFYYDYTDYQVSQIRDRSAVNENFDSEIWGLELETVFAPSLNWQFLANIGYLKTRIADGETSIDLMNRTQDNPGYTLVKPWVQLPSNCVVPTGVAERYLQTYPYLQNYWEVCSGLGGVLRSFSIGNEAIDPATEQPYDHTNYPELNGGAGFRADLGGNELPNSPNLTVTLGGQYSFDLTRDWRATTRLDYYWQDESYHRIYNTEPYDRLKSWSNTNLSFWVNNANSGITVEAYVKNVFNETPITGAFLNSDDTGLTTNVFMFDPRLIGVSVRKEW